MPGLKDLAAEQSGAMLRKVKEPDPASAAHDPAEDGTEPDAAAADRPEADTAITRQPSAELTAQSAPSAARPIRRSRPADRRAPAQALPVAGSPWAEVEAAYWYAKRNPTDWDNYTAMLPEDLWHRLKRTATFHSRRTRSTRTPIRLGFNHLLEAAFATLPRTANDEYVDAEAAGALGRQWVAYHHQGYGDRQSSGSRLSKRQKTQMEDLGDVLKGFRDRVSLWQVQAAVIEAFLDDLDSEYPRD